MKLRMEIPVVLSVIRRLTLQIGRSHNDFYYLDLTSSIYMAHICPMKIQGKLHRGNESYTYMTCCMCFPL